MSNQYLIDGSEKASCTIILAHGAGAGMDSEFMAYFASALADEQLRVIRFEFPYMRQRRETGNKRPPDRPAVLHSRWLEVIGNFQGNRLVLAGKSLGGRIASYIADETQAAGLVCLGYPFHPLGKPEQLRVDHLRELRTPTLILQGERDSFGNQAQVLGYNLPEQIRVHWLQDGDHSFKPRKASGRTQRENWQQAVELAAEFAKQL